jgi:hypothetical protein
MHAEGELVHHRAVGAGGLLGVLLAAALLEAGEGAVLARGVDERVAARVDLRLAASEVERGGLFGVLRALDVGLHGKEVGAAGLRGRAAALARLRDALGGRVQLFLTAPPMGDAGGELLGGALFGALSEGAYALEAEGEGAGTHEPVIGGVPTI